MELSQTEFHQLNRAFSEVYKRLQNELENREDLAKNLQQHEYLYPDLDDPNFNTKIALKKEFNDTRYDGQIYSVEEYSKLLASADYELSPHQAFVRNFLSFQTPYNSLLLFHGRRSINMQCSDMEIGMSN